MWQEELEFWCSARKRNHQDNIVLLAVNIDIDKRQRLDALTGLMRPRSPWRASVGASSVAVIPRLLQVATNFAPIFPLLPTPHTTSFPCSLQLLAMTVTAVVRLSLERASFWYRFSRCDKAARSVEMTCKASLIAEASMVETVPSGQSGGVIGSVGIDSETGAGHNGIDGVSGVARAAWLMHLPKAILG